VGGPTIDYVKPNELVAEALQAGEKKASLPVHDMLVLGFLSGVILGYATSQAMVIQAQGLSPFVGAAAFPVGFAILTLLGLELATGNFALLPMGLMARRVRVSGLLRNWGWVYLGNLIGAVLYAALFYLTVTKFGATDGGAIGEQVQQVAEKKTLAYADIGVRGWSTALVSGILANWMVTLGAVLAFASRSTIGKIVALWMPIMIFFAHGYEHSIVNMYVIPTGMFLGSPISMTDWWLWNQIPVTIGNILGGAVFTGAVLYFIYGRGVKESRTAAKSLDRKEKT
jgi:formate/nitrite transporter